MALACPAPGDVIAGLGVGFGLANLVGMMLAWRILSRRMRGLDGYRIGRSLVRMHAATLPAALLAVLVGASPAGTRSSTSSSAAASLLAMYLVFARALRIDELCTLSRTLLSGSAGRRCRAGAATGRWLRDWLTAVTSPR